jgi:hypothetical protein
MKTITTLALFFLYSLNFLFAEAPLPGTIPDKLTIGKMQILEKLADATSVTVQCSAPGMKTFSKTVNIPADFDSVEDITSVVESIQVEIAEPSDPTTEIWLGASIADAIGDVQFQAVQTFKLEKVYSGGEPSYQIPSWAGNLYFLFVNQGIYFPGAQSASFIGKDFEFPLQVNEGWITAGYFGNGFLKVVTSSGTYYYDWNTGVRVNVDESLEVSQATFEDIIYVRGDNVYYTVYPEWNYVPWLQVKAPANGVITLNVSSMNGYTPIGVYVRSFKEIRTGTEQPPQPYSPGMTLKVKPGQTVYIWFDFSSWVWGMGSSSGKG